MMDEKHNKIRSRASKILEQGQIFSQSLTEDELMHIEEYKGYLDKQLDKLREERQEFKQKESSYLSEIADMQQHYEGVIQDTKNENNKTQSVTITLKSELNQVKLERKFLQKQIASIQSQLETYRNSAENAQSEMKKEREYIEIEKEDIKTERNKLDKLIDKNDTEYNQKLEELSQVRDQYAQKFRENLEKNSNEYVSSTIDKLEVKRKHLHYFSIAWGIAGLIVLILGLGTVTYLSWKGIPEADVSNNVFYYFYLIFRGVIIVSLTIYLSCYCFKYSNIYMRESLKHDERQHILSYGDFYLKTYGANAKWDDVKEVFKHWNISNGTHLSEAENPESTSKIIEAISLLGSSLGKKIDLKHNEDK